MKITKYTKLKRKEFLKTIAIFCVVQIVLACFLINGLERTKVATDSNNSKNNTGDGSLC